MKQVLLLSLCLMVFGAGSATVLCHFGCKDNECTADEMCSNGCKPFYSGVKCDKCLNCNIWSCQSTGICSFGCRIGHYGSLCESLCSTQCSALRCDRWTGDCHACVAGYYGTSCDKKCPTHCLICNRNFDSSKRCKVCAKGYFGRMCEPCPIHCKHCDRKTNQCITCEKGYFGPVCEHSCTWCLLEMCDDRTENCTNGCAGEYYGSGCNKRCPANCRTCDQPIETDNTCLSCKRGYYGPACEKACSAYCRSDLCDKASGHCLEYCLEGYYGPGCDKECPEKCLECDRDFMNTSYCIACKQGYYGQACQRSCSEHCRYGWCDKKTGHCTDGCDRRLAALCLKCQYSSGTICAPCSLKCINNSCGENDSCPMCESGYSGPACSECATGYHKHGSLCEKCPANCESCTNNSNCNTCKSESAFGRYCQQHCSDHCVYQQCEHITGKCVSGCIMGYYGEWCNNQCSETCATKNGHQYCNIKTGRCDYGCQSGHFGLDCKERCSVYCVNKTCSRATGECIQACDDGVRRQNCAEALIETGSVETGKLAGLISLVVIIVILTATLTCVVIRYKRKRNVPVSFYLTPVGHGNLSSEGRHTGGLPEGVENRIDEETEREYGDAIAGHDYIELDELGYINISKHHHRQSSDAIEDSEDQPHPCEAKESTYESIDMHQHASEDATYESIV